MLSETELAEIRARVEAATPGPWGYGYAFEKFSHGALVTALNQGVVCELATVLTSVYQGDIFKSKYRRRTESDQEANGRFIASARQDVPALLAHVEYQAERIEKLEAALRTIRERPEGLSICPFCGNDGLGHAEDCPALLAREALTARQPT